MNEKLSAHARTVLDVLAQKRCHLTAEEILEHTQGISTATVYRALDHLTEIGKIRRLSLGKKSFVYEYIRDSHLHFVCRNCQQVFDIPADFFGMMREAAKCCGYQAEWGEVTAYGVCAACDQTRKVEAEA